MLADKIAKIDKITEYFRSTASHVDYCSLRLVAEQGEMLSVRQNVLEPVERLSDVGAMLTVIHQGAMGYAATSDLSEKGIREALAKAQEWADCSRRHSLVDYSGVRFDAPRGAYQSPLKQSWNSLPLKAKVDLLHDCNRALKAHEYIVDWHASLWNREIDTLYITAHGGEVRQKFNLIVPVLAVTAYDGNEAIQRSGGSRGGRQAGLEVLAEIDFFNQAAVIANEALELLAAPNCPSGVMDLLLDSDQMILQIHESVGHPLEIDRILGDERNYAGTSFVTQAMIGSYEYGSPLMNITFDPTVSGQLASYAFDDDGQPAAKKHIIEKGVLKAGLGGITSQMRSGLAGVANSRASGWNREPIDRMANLNLEPGGHGLADMIAQVEKGVFMKTNTSWSIDDSRNKFQFGCEWGQLIENGALTTVVKKPNYRGISATFWRNLKMVGDQSTYDVLGTPNCGKGEPNQVIWVGHASPACLFSDVDVFGGV